MTSPRCSGLNPNPNPVFRFALGLLIGLATLVGGEQTLDSPNGSSDAVWKRFQSGEYQEAARAFESLEESGDPEVLFALGFMHDWGVGVPIDDERALALQTEAAETGHVLAARYLAWKYRIGFGVEPDPAASDKWSATGFEASLSDQKIPRRWLKVAGREMQPNFQAAAQWNSQQADLGVPFAFYNLSRYFLGGRGIEVNEGVALQFMLQAGDGGYVPAVIEMLPLLQMGLLEEEGPERVERFLKTAAEAGDLNAQEAWGERLLDSEDETDREAGVYWLKEAVAGGSDDAAEALGDHLSRDGASDEELAEAVRFYRIGAERGHVECQSDMGWHYDNGVGVEASPEQAVYWFSQAAEEGDGWSARQIGDIYRLGRGVDVDLERAVEWYERGAELEDDQSCLRLGHMYFRGLGVPEDRSIAFEWYEQAAREGNAEAQRRVGMMLYLGDSIDKDREEAVTWFELAAKNGDPHSYVLLGKALTEGKEGPPPEAIEAFRKAYEAGDDEGRRLLAMALVSSDDPDEVEEGLGLIGPDLEQDPEAAASLGVHLVREGQTAILREKGQALVEQAAAAGATVPLTDLARTFIYCPEAERDIEKAMTLVDEAECRGDADAPLCRAEVLIAEEFFLGEPSADPIRILESLVKTRDPEAAALLAGLLEDGILIPQDRERAQNLYDLARNFGFRGDWIKLPSHFEPVDEPLLKLMIEEARTRERLEIPQPLHRVPPVYPPVPKRYRMEGSVRIRFIVDEEGRVVSPEVTESSHAVFEERAVEAVREWRFAPAYRDGEPVKAGMMLPLRFNFD